jgi:hypothetical protein
MFKVAEAYSHNRSKGDAIASNFASQMILAFPHPCHVTAHFCRLNTPVGQIVFIHFITKSSNLFRI